MIPAAESALRSHPCVAVSSAQVRSVYLRTQYPKNICPNDLRRGINALDLVLLRWPLLKCPSMAGFEMSTEAS
jgi:hypothetical protein